MYSIDVADYGLKLRTEGALTPEEAGPWERLYLQKLTEVVKRGKPFGQYVDLRGFKPGAAETQQVIDRCMKAFKKSGGQRSAVVLDVAVASMQIRRLAIQSGMYEWERYIDPETHPDFEKVALGWIVSANDPDVK